MTTSTLPAPVRPDAAERLRLSVAEADGWMADGARADRLSDAVRADTEARLDDLAVRVLDLVGGGFARAQRARAAELLRDGGWPDPATRARARRRALAQSIGTGLARVAALFAEEPLRTAGERSATDQAEPLALEADFVWRAAAALRVALAEFREVGPSDDHRLRAAATTLLEEIDARPAPSAPRDGPASRLLLTGDLDPALARLAGQLDMPAERLERWLVAPDPLALGVALRAAGEDMAAVAEVLAAVAQAGARPIEPTFLAVDVLRRLDVDAAARLLATVR